MERDKSLELPHRLHRPGPVQCRNDNLVHSWQLGGTREVNDRNLCVDELHMSTEAGQNISKGQSRQAVIGTRIKYLGQP